MDSVQAAPVDTELTAHPIRFHGSAGEFFRIWIVNTLLTLLTLGIYSAWAKVRTNRYFYGNTVLADASFDYHARPLQILKGRLILAAGLVAYFGLGYLAPGAELAIVLVVVLLIPWLLVRSLAFRMYNTSYRNIRFGFVGSVGESYVVAIKALLATVLSLGIFTFWGDWLRSRFVVNHLRFGRSPFATDCTAGAFFSIYLQLFGIAIALLLVFAIVMSFVLAGVVGELETALGVGAGAELEVPSEVELPPELVVWLAVVPMLFYIPFGLYLYAFLQAKKFNLLAATTRIGDHRLVSRLSANRLFWVHFSNLIAVVASVGLLIPWAKIRLARYRLERVEVLVAGSLDHELAAEGRGASATGEEIGDYVDLDLGF